jgi:exosortase H (IPTLxxWG-CTERM-specific)
MLRFFLLFLAIQAALFAAELTRPIQKAVVIPFTEGIAAISAWLVTSFDDDVISQGIILRDQGSGFAVSIEAGCNGVEATIVLVAAMLAFPSPWRYKLWGILVGFLTVQALNLLRIITLFYLGQWNETAFEWAHLYIWQALIMLDVLVVFLIWLRLLPREPDSDPGTPPQGEPARG